MKKLFISAVVMFALIAHVSAARNATNTNLFHDFTSIIKNTENVAWTYGDNFQKVSLVVAGAKTEVYYTPNGELIGASKSFAYDLLPKAALNTLATKYAYPTYALNDCIIFENADDEVNYFLSMTKANQLLVLQISEKGNVSVISRKG